MKARRVECDEIWSFNYCKRANVATAKAAPEGAGDAWTWTALDADSKLIISYLVGGRDAEWAGEFMQDVADRVANRIQLTTDGHAPYLGAVEDAFGADIDYAMLVKIYGETGATGPERKYSPGVCTGALKRKVEGNPDRRHVSTSYVEKHNQSMRQHMRRFTRLTAAHSKKLVNHIHMVALYRLVQFRPDQFGGEDGPGYGGWYLTDPLGRGRYCEADRSLRKSALGQTVTVPIVTGNEDYFDSFSSVASDSARPAKNASESTNRPVSGVP